ncbi:MAG: ornithine decarboxylase, partial [Gammaproteobacteria bacterium]|nr:ornithine decarboxylase [Gammaproteobacteria bacterium]
MNDKSSGALETGATKPFNFYYNASQFRIDTWHRVKLFAEKLSAHHARKADITKYKAQVHDALTALNHIEDYTAFPNKEDFRYLWRLFEHDEFPTLARVIGRLVRALTSDSYRRRHIDLAQSLEKEDQEDLQDLIEEEERDASERRPYFELLVVDDLSPNEDKAIRTGFMRARRPEDRFMYNTVVVPSFEDAIIAVLFNYNIQAVLIRYGFPFRSKHDLAILKRYLSTVDDGVIEAQSDTDRSVMLGAVLHQLRPELDLYLVTDVGVEDAADRSAEHFRRVFYREMDFVEQHLSILRGINDRYQTPFFTALKDYSRQPTGVFHAMPISRGKSIIKSHWIQDMGQFYGMNIFLAETSSTSGGLDSLLDPHGPIKDAQELAARAYGA